MVALAVSDRSEHISLLIEKEGNGEPELLITLQTFKVLSRLVSFADVVVEVDVAETRLLQDLDRLPLLFSRFSGKRSYTMTYGTLS